MIQAAADRGWIDERAAALVRPEHEIVLQDLRIAGTIAAQTAAHAGRHVHHLILREHGNAGPGQTRLHVAQGGVDLEGGHP